jgi:predicted adenylyl cyclase CyaB
MAEIEVKAKVKDFTKLIDKLQDFGCTLSEPVAQKDRNYIRNGLDYENVNRDCTPVLRIREEKNKVTFTIKYNRDPEREMDMIEKQVTISDAKEFEEMLKIMDYYEVMEINKTRRKGTYKEYEICLDEVETLGSFIEVEKISDEDGAKVHEELTTFLKSLGLQEENRVVYGYDTLILQNLKKKDAH